MITTTSSSSSAALFGAVLALVSLMSIIEITRDDDTVALNLQAHEAQRRFLSLDERFVGFIGGVGSGKTVAAAIWVLIKALNNPDSKGIVGTRTYKLLRDVLVSTFQDVCPEDLIANFNKNEMILDMVNGTRIYFRSLESERIIDNIRGYSINWALIDEAAYVSYYAVKVLNARMREGEDQQLAITTTPQGYNWVYQKFEEPDRKIPQLEDELEEADEPKRRREIKNDIEDLEETRDEWVAVKNISSDDNPFLPDEYLDSLKAQYTGDYLAQELNGQFVKFKGLIYPEFDAVRNTVTPTQVEDMDFERTIYGYDAGYKHPRVLLKVQRNESGQWVVTREFYRVESMLSDALDEFKQMGADAWPVYADPSAKGEIKEMQGAGIDARSADNEVEAGIQRVKSYLANDELLVSELCQNTINEFSTYQWQGDEDDPSDKPLKENDHAMDALRYALYTAPSECIPMTTL